MSAIQLPSEKDIRDACKQGEEAVFALFRATVRSLEERIQTLEEQLAKTSSKDGTPLSSYRYEQPAPRSLKAFRPFLGTFKGNRWMTFLVIGVALCIVLIAIPGIWDRLRPDVPPTPLSAIVLQLGDLNAQVFEQMPPATGCNTYLSLQFSQEAINQSQMECYQVKFKSRDNTLVILNAIWDFEDLALAESEINRLIELMPSVGNIDVSMANLPSPLGEKSGASSAVIRGGGSPLYVSNLYWRRGTTVVRLSVISYQSPFSTTNMIMPAQMIEARLINR